MKAPEKIYLQVCGDCTINDKKKTCEQCCKDNPISNGREVTWCADKIFDNDVEYTRTDAFIEKAARWIENNVPKYSQLTDEDEYGEKLKEPVMNVFYGQAVKNFINYMKG